jgi:hypothetical protein
MGMKIRTANADTEEIQKLIDESTQIDSDIKNLGVQATANKVKITEYIQEKILEEDESSIKVIGKNANVTFSMTEKYALIEEKENLEIIDEAIDGDFLEGIVSKDTTISVPADVLEEVLALLKEDGLDKRVKVKTVYSIDGKKYRKYLDNPKTELQEELGSVLKGGISVNKSPRLKFGLNV